MFLVQEVVSGTVSIWPGNVLGWLQLIAALLVVIGGTLGVVWKMIDNKFTKLEKSKASIEDHRKLAADVKECEGYGRELKARIEKIEFEIQGFGFKHENLGKEITMVNDSTKNLDRVVRELATSTSEEIKSISKSVMRMEGVVSQLAKSVSKE